VLLLQTPQNGAMFQETLRLVRVELTDLMIQLLKEKDQREEILKERLVSQTN